MSDCCDHDCQPFEPGALGIPRVGRFNPEAFEQAVTDLLLACGVAPDSVHTGKTARRVRDLWIQGLTARKGATGTVQMRCSMRRTKSVCLRSLVGLPRT